MKKRTVALAALGAVAVLATPASAETINLAAPGLVPVGVTDPSASIAGVAPERAVVVEDAPAGVLGAHRAGMVAIGVGPHHAELGADRSAETLADLSIDTFSDLVLAASELG